MSTLRSKWDAIYVPWYGKIIAGIIAFLCTYLLAQAGPLSVTASLIAAGVAAIFCLWNPGGTAVIYIAAFFISTMHINSAMTGLIFVFVLVYCMMGYASVAVMMLTPVLMLSSLPDSLSWGAFVLAMYFAYRCREKAVVVFYPIVFTLLTVMLAKSGTAGFLYPDGFTLTDSQAANIDAFISAITFDADSRLLPVNGGEIVKLVLLTLLAGSIVWLVFQNKWMRRIIKNLDICEAVMFAISGVVIILLDLSISAVFQIETGASYGTVTLSIALAYVITRPFATDKIAETLISKSTLRHRKDAALTFTAVKPKADWQTPFVSDEIKDTIKSWDCRLPSGILIHRDAEASAAPVADLIARHYNAALIKIDHAVYDKLYGDKREETFRKIFEDAKAQGPAVICFNDADKFFYKVDDSSGEYVKRYHRIYMEVVCGLKNYSNVSVVLITDDISKIDDSLQEKNIITKVQFFSKCASI